MCTLDPQGIVHGDLTARNVMLVSLERAGAQHGHHGHHAHWQGVDLPSSSDRIPSHSHGHVPEPVTCQPSGEPGGTTPFGLTAAGSSVGSGATVPHSAADAAAGAALPSSASAAGESRCPCPNRYADAFGPRHVCHVPPSAAASAMPSTASMHAASIATTTAGGGRSGSGRLPTLGSTSSAAFNAGSGAVLGAGVLPAGPAERPGIGAGSAGPLPQLPAAPVCCGCGRCFVAKVADFGLSRTLDTQSKILTKTTGTVGTEGEGWAGRNAGGKDCTARRSACDLAVVTLLPVC